MKEHLINASVIIVSIIVAGAIYDKFVRPNLGA